MVVNEIDILPPVILVFICQCSELAGGQKWGTHFIIGTYKQNFKLSITLLCQNDACISPDEIFCILKCSKILCCDHWQCMWSQFFVRFALSLTISEISEKIENFRNSDRFLKICDIFSKCKKILCGIIDNFMWPPNFVCFALSVTNSEISANLCFLKFSKIFVIFKMFKNVMRWSMKPMQSQNFARFALSQTANLFHLKLYMISMAAIFNSRVNLIAPLAASQKDILSYFWESWNSYS